MPDVPIHSDSVGDARRFRTLADLQDAYRTQPRPDRDVGRVHLIVRRGEAGLRACPARVELTPTSGIPGDAWGRKPHKSMNGQLTVIERGVAEMVAHGQPLTLFGDNLIVELDLTAGSLPIGSTLQMGGATLVVTPMPHNGCSKFQARFGKEALKFVARKPTRSLNLRGVYMRVTHAGEVAVGDAIRVLHRPPPAQIG